MRLCPNKEDMEWSFGQVMSIVLLAVPLVTVFEFFYPGEFKVYLQLVSSSNC